MLLGSDSASKRIISERIKTWQQIPETGAVVFSDAVKHDGPGRHVNPHGERLCGKQHLREKGDTGSPFLNVTLDAA